VSNVLVPGKCSFKTILLQALYPIKNLILVSSINLKYVLKIVLPSIVVAKLLDSEIIQLLMDHIFIRVFNLSIPFFTINLSNEFIVISNWVVQIKSNVVQFYL